LKKCDYTCLLEIPTIRICATGEFVVRTFTVLLLLAGMALQALASAVKANVEQLEQLLTAIHGKSDSQIAEQLSALELTERLSEWRLARLEAGLPGSRSRKRLTLLANASAFLDLPVSELPDTPRPDYAKQVFLLGLVRTYVANTILKLPNFFATRETTNYVSTSATFGPIRSTRYRTSRLKRWMLHV
jgi:hypothetical protein